jgi:Divergent InlB B-repeat domain
MWYKNLLFIRANSLIEFMKRATLTLLSILGLSATAFAQSQLYLNVGTVNSPTNIDATTFENVSYFAIDGVTTVDGVTEITGGQLEGKPFETQDTLNWINTDSGVMVAQPGFIFEAITSKTIHPSASFYNAGSITALDTPAEGVLLETTAAGFIVEPPGLTPLGLNTAIPSLIQINATNITNPGTLTVGDFGLLSISGENVNLANGALIAGTSSSTDTNATGGRGVLYGITNGTALSEFYTPAAGVYDIYWSFTNDQTINLATLAADLSELNLGEPATLAEVVTNRTGKTNIVELPESLFLTGKAANFQAAVYASGPQTNIYYNIVLINTAFADSNITATVGFLDGYENVLSVGDSNGTEAMVQFSAPVQDVITGQTVTSSIYLLDVGAVQAPYTFAQNVDYTSAIGKPDCFEITTVTPEEWLAELPGNTAFNINMIYGNDPVTGGALYSSATAASTNGSYGAQVNLNPEETDGIFPLTEALMGTATGLDIPALTNGTGRIEINANQLDVSNLRMRASGTVTLNVTNLTGVPTGTDWSSVNANLGNVKAALSVSNVFPRQFSRLRGDILAYSADWMSNQTNDGAGNAVTIIEHVHLLVIDQALQDSFTSSVLNLALRGSNVVQNDDVIVLQNVLFQATNLTLAANVHLTAGANDFFPSNAPVLENLTITTNGSLSVDNLIDIGASTTAAPISPLLYKYTVNSVTNLGSISSGGLYFQPKIFANGGILISSNSGAMRMSAKTNLLGAGIGLTNSIVADSDIDFSSVSIQASNSSITAGLGGSGRLNLYVLSQLTDFLPGVASTNSYGTNIWQVNGGFNMTNKPTSGDLFGTQIITIATNYGQVIDHVWAATDYGPNVSGFFNNQVIGHLVLDNQKSGAKLRFSAAGKKNALYVDYLELRDLSFSDYHNGLVVDPNFTIYFANCNFDPTKLQQVYSNVVWVPQFAGPNSSVEVPYKGGSNCVMNALVATSSEISSDYDGIPNSKKTYILDNSNPYVGTIPCPTSITSTESLLTTNTNNGVLQSLVVWTIGQGVVSPALNSVKVGQAISLTAHPDAGYIFLNWSGGVSSTQPTINFTMPATNAVLTATFIRNPFIALAGTYNGLFVSDPVSNITVSNSGFVTFTVSSNGVFSGHLQINASKYTLSSQFFGSGNTTVNATSGTNVLSVTLQIDTTNTSNPSPQVSGQVSNGTWDATLTADLAPAWTAKKPAPQTGTYTMALPGNGTGVASPGGDSYGTVTVNNLGNLTAALHLSDGVNLSLSQSVPVAASGLWPLYLAPSTGPAQPLIGWISFNTNAPASFGGLVNWIKAPAPGTYYTNGFNTNATLQGSIFSKTTSLKLTNPTIALSGGNLLAPVTDSVTASGQVYANTNKSLTLTINASTGAFTGSYTAPGSKVKVSLAGVVLQDSSTAEGFFLGTNQSGAVLLQGN